MATLDGTMGAMFLGVVLCSALWGVSLTQAFHYFTHYTDDALHVKVLVAAVLTAETIHQALITQALYAYLITDFGDNAALKRIERNVVVEVFFEVRSELASYIYIMH
ncbi:hypothetical protein C8Q74DRAFT_1234339 [Fomes fomentarius]|nr:hypothetical protein C8Q74DRAFT_1234339 [Fomes fomentarius]